MAEDESGAAVIRKAVIEDVPAIHKMVNHFAGNRRMLSRSLAEIYEYIRDYFVAEEGGAIVGSAALHVFWSDLAEIRALAVLEGRQGSGLGRRLLEACCGEARSMGVKRIFALTFQPGFFARCGFEPVSKNELPHKIWSDCIRCPMFPDCDEEALIMNLGK